MLKTVLDANVNTSKEDRLANTIAQRRRRRVGGSPGWRSRRLRGLCGNGRRQRHDAGDETERGSCFHETGLLRYGVRHEVEDDIRLDVAQHEVVLDDAILELFR